MNGESYRLKRSNDRMCSAIIEAGIFILVLGQRETGAVVKVQGTITTVDQARARFALTQAGQENLLREGAPVYLEPSEDLM